MTKWTKAVCLTLCAGLAIAGVAAGFKAQPGDKKQPPAAPTGQPGVEDMMQMMNEMSKPVAQHEIIKNFAGTWDASVKMWMDPKQEPMTSKGTMKCTMLHGDRYLLGHFTGDVMGSQFSGTLLWAYNRVDERYESTWSDSMSTTIMYMTGKPSADGKVVESTGKFRMPGPDGKNTEITQREKTTMHAKDKYVLEMWHSTPEQGEQKVMEITYTRAAGGDKPAEQKRTGVPMPAGTTMPPTPK